MGSPHIYVVDFKCGQSFGEAQEHYLYCARYTTLNDPMEGVFRSSKVFRESNNYRTTRKAIVDNKTEIGLCSFSEVHDHELMWAHYADQYRGICIGCSLAKLLDNLDDEVSFVRMYYNEAVPIVCHNRQEPGDVAKCFCLTRTTGGFTNMNGQCLRH